MQTPIKALLLLISFSFITVTVSEAQEPATFGTSDNVLARQGDAVITQAELDAALTRIPEEHRKLYVRDGRRVDDVIQLLLRNRLLAKTATEAGFADERLTRLRVALGAEKELADAWIGKVMEDMPPADYEALAQERFLLNQDEYMTEEMVDVSHILISSDSRPDEEAAELANTLKAQLDEEPESFQALVDEYSEDPSKSNNFGRFPHVKHGQMVKAFEEKAFSMQERGEISEPVATDYGYHIIRLNNKIPPRKMEFNEVKAKMITQEKERYKAEYRARYMRSLHSEEIVVSPGAVEEMSRRYFGEDLSGADLYQKD